MNVLVITQADDRDLVAVVEIAEGENPAAAFRRWVERDDVCSFEEALDLLNYEAWEVDNYELPVGKE